MIRHSLTFGSTGVVTVGHQAGSDARRFSTYRGSITVEAIEQNVLLIGGRDKVSPTVTQSTKIPETALVVGTQTIQPTEDLRFNQHPAWNCAEMSEPEIMALVVTDLSSRNVVNISIYWCNHENVSFENKAIKKAPPENRGACTLEICRKKVFI
jgi:hypothetical protein